jgi:hypothetical protein
MCYCEKLYSQIRKEALNKRSMKKRNLFNEDINKDIILLTYLFEILSYNDNIGNERNRKCYLTKILIQKKHL